VIVSEFNERLFLQATVGHDFLQIRDFLKSSLEAPHKAANGIKVGFLVRSEDRVVVASGKATNSHVFCRQPHCANRV